jgi:hypothetical protein
MAQIQDAIFTKDILDFVNHIEKNYNKKIQVIVTEDHSKEINIDNIGKSTRLKKIEELVIDAMHECHPDLQYIKSLSCRLRRREYILWVQAFGYISFKIGFTKSYIGKHIKKNHATIIHGIKQVEDLLSINDREMTETYNLTINKIKDYVGIVTTDTETENDTKSVLSALRNKEEPILTIT